MLFLLRHTLQVGPDDSLRQVTDRLLQNDVAMVPVLNFPPQNDSVPQLLHLACLSGVLKCEFSPYNRRARFVGAHKNTLGVVFAIGFAPQFPVSPDVKARTASLLWRARLS